MIFSIISLLTYVDQYPISYVHPVIAKFEVFQGIYLWVQTEDTDRVCLWLRANVRYDWVLMWRALLLVNIDAAEVVFMH